MATAATPAATTGAGSSGFQFLPQLLGGTSAGQTGALQNILQNFTNSWNTEAGVNAGLVNQYADANAAKMGIEDSPAAADIEARAQAQNSAATNAAYSQQTMGFGSNLMSLASQIQETQNALAFQAQQAQLARQLQETMLGQEEQYGTSQLSTQDSFAQAMYQQQLAGQEQLAKQQVQNQLAYQSGMIPITASGFQTSIQDLAQAHAQYPQLFPASPNISSLLSAAGGNGQADPGFLKTGSTLLGGQQGGGGGGGGYTPPGTTPGAGVLTPVPGTQAPGTPSSNLPPFPAGTQGGGTTSGGNSGQWNPEGPWNGAAPPDPGSLSSAFGDYSGFGSGGSFY